MAAAFFASLLLFSCIHIDTKNDPADDSVYLPLNGNGCQEEISVIEIPIASERYVRNINSDVFVLYNLYP